MTIRFRAGAALLAVYAVVIVINAAINAGLSGDLSGLSGGRFWMRLGFVAFLVYGLLQSAMWARWTAIAFASVVGLLSLFALWTLHQTGLFELRPYPVLDYAAFAIMSIVLIAAAIVLLLPRRDARGF